MNELKKNVKISTQGICVILILNIIANIFGIIVSDSLLSYVAYYGATYLYIGGLIAGLVLYNKEKYSLGAEIVQWVGLGTMMLTFSNAIMTYAITGTLGYKIWLVLTAIIISIILIVEALIVIRLESKSKNSNLVVAVSLTLIAIMLIIGLVNTRELKIKIEIDKYNKNQQIQNELVNSDNSSEDKLKLDPNKKYDNIVWGKIIVKNSAGSFYEIQDDVIKFTNVGVNSQISVIGTPIKLTISEDIVYILTREGNVYYLDAKNAKFKFADVGKYNVVDIATVTNYTNETVYFLTEEGTLIDKNGVSYDKYSFSGKQKIKISDLTVDISFDKYGYIYFYNGLLNEYEAMVDKTNNLKITAKQIYTFSNEVLVLSKDNRLYSFDGTSNKVEYVKEGVSTVYKRHNDKKTINIVIAFTDKTINIYEKLKSAYNVTKGIGILGDSIPDYDSYKHHKDEIWSGVKTNNANIKNNKLYIDGKEVEVKISGNLKSIEEIESISVITLYILTDKGEVWSVSLDKITDYKIYEKKNILSGYKVLDMTMKTETDGTKKVYYLTDTGMLLDEKENQYIAN